MSAKSAAGAAVGRGLDFLFNPQLVMNPQTAYTIMAVGMLNGTIFANGRSFSMYFFGQYTDYLGARDMVNANGDHVAAANAAVLFEQLLLSAQPPLDSNIRAFRDQEEFIRRTRELRSTRDIRGGFKPAPSTSLGLK